MHVEEDQLILLTEALELSNQKYRLWISEYYGIPDLNKTFDKPPQTSDQVPSRP